MRQEKYYEEYYEEEYYEERDERCSYERRWWDYSYYQDARML
jgi:hypothetical protein